MERKTGLRIQRLKITLTNSPPTNQLSKNRPPATWSPNKTIREQADVESQMTRSQVYLVGTTGPIVNRAKEIGGLP